MCGLEQKRDLYKSQIQMGIYNKKNSSLPSNIITKITKDEYTTEFGLVRQKELYLIMVLNGKDIVKKENKHYFQYLY